MQFTPLGPWGVGASAGPATEGLKGLSGRVADRCPLEGDTVRKRVNNGHTRDTDQDHWVTERSETCRKKTIDY